MSEEVKAILIRYQLHSIRRNRMHGYETMCGKRASLGHAVFRVDPRDIECPVCRAAELDRAAVETRSGAAGARGTHDPEAGGSTPPSATKD